MKRFAFINSEGEVAYTLSCGVSTNYVSGNTYGDYLAIEIPHNLEEDYSYYHDSVFWDFDTAQWATKPTKPGVYYFFQDKQWNLDTVKLGAALRDERDAKLAACDWTVMPDSPLSAEKQAEWQTYRQGLRDVPANNPSITHLDQVVWPTPPA